MREYRYIGFHKPHLSRNRHMGWWILYFGEDAAAVKAASRWLAKQVALGRL